MSRFTNLSAIKSFRTVVPVVGKPIELGIHATATITMTGVAIADETFVVGSQTFTWKAARTTTGEVTIGATASAAGDNIVTAILADIPTEVVAVNASGTVTLTSVVAGAAGNDVVATEASTNMAITAFTGGIDVRVADGVALSIKPKPSITTMYLGDSITSALSSSARAYNLGSVETVKLQVDNPRRIWVDTTNAGDYVECIVEV